MQKIRKQLAESKMPLFWQKFGLAHALMVTITAFIPNEDIRFSLYPFIGAMILIALAAAIKQQVNMLKSWYLMMASGIFFEISVILASLAHFGLSITPDLIFFMKQAGVIVLTVFAIYSVSVIEKRFNLEGIIIDFTLVLLSFVSAIFILSPELLDIFLYNYTLVQQFELINIVLGSLLIIIGIIYQVITKYFKFKVFILLLSLTFFIFHFSIELLTASGGYSQSMSKVSWFLFQITGTLLIFFSFLERFELKYAHKANTKLSLSLTWGASIFAILIVPITLLINAIVNAGNNILFIASIAGLLLGSVVVWRFVVLVKSFNEQKEILKNVAYIDKLTNVLSYFGFCEEFLESDTSNSLVIAINIDDFKSINDLYGRRFGDEIIKKLSQRLLALSNVKLVSRTGGDTFIILLSTTAHQIQKEIKSIQAQLGVWDSLDGRRIAVPLTLGATHSTVGIDIDTLSSQAEKALQIARSKHLSFFLYNEKENSQLLPRNEIRTILQQAIDSNHLPVHFQPIYNLDDGSLKALELLIRVKSAKHGTLQPSQFLDQAREYGLLTELTKICIHMIAVNYEKLPNTTININLAPYMLESKEVLKSFIHFFKAEGLHSKNFCIEVTEDEDVPIDSLVKALTLLKKEGFTIAMDDFGTGYSSLSRLSLLPFDTVKIDRSLLLAASNDNNTILESSIQLIKKLGLAVVVEGVETIEQLRLIEKLGANSVQGFLFSRPVGTTKAFDLPLNATSIISNLNPRLLN